MRFSILPSYESHEVAFMYLICMTKRFEVTKEKSKNKCIERDRSPGKRAFSDSLLDECGGYFVLSIPKDAGYKVTKAPIKERFNNDWVNKNLDSIGG